jgi:uroporphyrinogen-III synthase
MSTPGEPLRGARIALLEARRESELASLVRRHGGEPVCAPALREVERDFGDELTAACRAVAWDRAIASEGESAGVLPARRPIVVLTTGTGLERVLRMAASLGQAPALRAGLERATIVCRGPKPIAVLKREGLPVHVRADPPHTTRELVGALGAIEVRGRDAVVVLDGGSGRTVAESLADRGARVFEVRPYEWALPEDLEPLRSLVREIATGRSIDVVAITTQAQARHLFGVAETMGVAAELAHALRERVVVAAVGPTCAQVLTELGVPPQVVPEQSKMGPMVLAIAEHLSRRR